MAKLQHTLDTRILVLFFLVATPFVAFGAYAVVGMASSSLGETVGASLEQDATQTSLLIERYVGEQFVMLRLIARYPEVSEALDAKGGGARSLEKQAQAWASADPALVRALTGSALAGRLRDVIAVRPGVRLLQVVDARGALVAASGRGGRFANGDSPWFASLAQEPVVERPYVSDVHRASGSSLAVLEVAWPVLSPEGSLRGAVRALIDAGDLYGVLAPVRIGATGHAELVRASDGLVLASDQGQRVLEQRLVGFELLRPVVQARHGYRKLPEFRAGGPSGASGEPARIVALSTVEQVPGVRWLVTVEQDLDEALAPLNRIRLYLWIHFAGAFGTVFLLGLYYSIKLEQPVLEDEVPIVEELEGRREAA
jgi:hypothetical protein